MKCPKCGKLNKYLSLHESCDEHLLYYECKDCDYEWFYDRNLEYSLKYTCEICDDNWLDFYEIYLCKKCGKVFCDTCGDKENNLCNNCINGE